MTQRERDPLTESDPHALLFGHDDEDGHDFGAGHGAGRATRSQRHQHRRRWRRNTRWIVLLAVVIVGVVGAGTYVWVRNTVEVKDYTGSGTTPVTVTVRAGDSAADIAATLKRAGVVRSVKAFTNAANGNSQSQSIQPGTYTLRKGMSGKNALTLLLDPKSRKAEHDVVVTEGATTLDVATRLAAALGVPETSVRKALADVGALGLPSTYTVGTEEPSSLEGFLYPATYTFDPGTKVADALTQMINAFIEQDRSSGFAAKAKAMGLTPYEALTIASIAQAEAKYADDLPKVVRVILNRIAAHQNLQIDATTIYGALLKGVDPRKAPIDNATFDTPYNSYTHEGLTPTPISNPGAEAMAAAVEPADGNWTYYVNGDKDGHLFFTSSEAEFLKAVEKCRANNWGCG